MRGNSTRRRSPDCARLHPGYRGATIALLKFHFRILNRYLIEAHASDWHLDATPVVPKDSFGRPLPETFRVARKPRLPIAWHAPSLPGGKMILLSNSFVRKRVISLATTVTVSAT